MTKRLNLWLLAIFLVLGLPTYWLMLDNRPGDARAKAVTIQLLRGLASSMPGDAPFAIRFEAVGRTLRMGNLSGAATGFRFNPITILVHMVDFRGRKPILIGSGLTRKQAQSLNFTEYNGKAQARVFATLRQASHVITLGREPTQTGGLRSLEKSEPETSLPARPAIGEAARTGNRPYALAPGVVVIPTPDRIPGTRLVYVRLASGREYLFAGNLSRTTENWRDLRIPARIITDFVQPENRQAAYSWLLTLRKLRREAPDLVIVSGNKIPKGGGLKHKFPATFAR